MSTEAQKRRRGMGGQFGEAEPVSSPTYDELLEQVEQLRRRLGEDQHRLEELAADRDSWRRECRALEDAVLRQQRQIRSLQIEADSWQQMASQALDKLERERERVEQERKEWSW